MWDWRKHSELYSIFWSCISVLGKHKDRVNKILILEDKTKYILNWYKNVHFFKQQTKEIMKSLARLAIQSLWFQLWQCVQKNNAFYFYLYFWYVFLAMFSRTDWLLGYFLIKSKSLTRESIEFYFHYLLILSIFKYT